MLHCNDGVARKIMNSTIFTVKVGLLWTEHKIFSLRDTGLCKICGGNCTILQRFCIQMKDNAPPVSFIAVVESPLCDQLDT